MGNLSPREKRQVKIALKNINKPHSGLSDAQIKRAAYELPKTEMVKALHVLECQEFCTDHYNHFGFYPMEFETSSGDLWGFDKIMERMTA